VLRQYQRLRKPLDGLKKSERCAAPSARTATSTIECIPASKSDVLENCRATRRRIVNNNGTTPRANALGFDQLSFFKNGMGSALNRESFARTGVAGGPFFIAVDAYPVFD